MTTEFSSTLFLRQRGESQKLVKMCDKTTILPIVALLEINLVILKLTEALGLFATLKRKKKSH